MQIVMEINDEILKQVSYLYVCSYLAYRCGFLSLNSFSYRCWNVSHYIETFQLELSFTQIELALTINTHTPTNISSSSLSILFVINSDNDFARTA